MIMENRTQRKVLVGLLWLLFSVCLLVTGYFSPDLSRLGAVVFLVVDVCVGWWLQTVIAIDVLYSDRETKVEA